MALMLLLLLALFRHATIERSLARGLIFSRRSTVILSLYKGVTAKGQ